MPLHVLFHEVLFARADGLGGRIGRSTRHVGPTLITFRFVVELSRKPQDIFL